MQHKKFFYFCRQNTRGAKNNKKNIIKGAPWRYRFTRAGAELHTNQSIVSRWNSHYTTQLVVVEVTLPKGLQPPRSMQGWLRLTQRRITFVNSSATAQRLLPFNATATATATANANANATATATANTNTPPTYARLWWKLYRLSQPHSTWPKRGRCSTSTVQGPFELNWFRP